MQVNTRKFFIGGLTAMVTWSLAFPFDSIKTRLQTSNTDNIPSYVFVRSIIEKEGFLILYRGLSLTLMRAFPTGATAMLINDTVKSKLTTSYGD